jgi:hypothetical protein
VRYCCREHQKDDWATHKLVCKRSPARGTDQEQTPPQHATTAAAVVKPAAPESPQPATAGGQHEMATASPRAALSPLAAVPNKPAATDGGYPTERIIPIHAEMHEDHTFVEDDIDYRAKLPLIMAESRNFALKRDEVISY